MNEEIMDERQLAGRWKVSVRKLQADRCKGGGCPYLKIGRLVRYRLADVEEMEQRSLRQNTSTER